MDPTQLVRQATPAEYPPVARGYIHETAKAFNEPLQVILPAGSTTHLYGPYEWGALHGSELPKAGAPCIVAFDEQSQATIIWWEGKQKEGSGAGPNFIRENTETNSTGTEANAAKGNHNIVLGNASTEGNGNLVLGNNTGEESTGEDNYIIGEDSGHKLTGHENYVFGGQAGDRISGTQNYAIGLSAGEQTSGSENYAIGESAGQAVTGTHNYAVGRGAGQLKGGSGNYSIGDSAAEHLEGERNLCLGEEAGLEATCNEGVFIGSGAGTKAAANGLLIVSPAGKTLVSGNGPESKLGFLGAAPVTRPHLGKESGGLLGEDTTLANALRAALIALGLGQE